MTAAEPDLGSPIAASARASQRERVKASQDMAAALAHELRGPVYGITSAAQLLRYRITDDPVLEKNIGRIMREAERLNTLVATLLEYGRPEPVRLAPANPDDIWSRVLADHRGALEARALLVTHIVAEPGAVCDVDPEQLAQAFANVLGNAIDAAPEGTDLAVSSSTTGGGAWESSLHNDGSPIAPDTLARAFEPLVSTKAGHPGIGLAITDRVVGDHGGAVFLESAHGAGTTLTFKLPASHG
jgi:two-component system, NtrC family, sensor histidine kinase AtoS